MRGERFWGSLSFGCMISAVFGFILFSLQI
jgi:hypothetical protein